MCSDHRDSNVSDTSSLAYVTNHTGTTDHPAINDDDGFFSFSNSTFTTIFFAVIGTVIMLGANLGRFYYRKMHQRRGNSAEAEATNGAVAPPGRPTRDCPSNDSSVGLATVPEGYSTQFSAVDYSNNNFLSNYSTYSTSYWSTDVAKT